RRPRQSWLDQNHRPQLGVSIVSRLARSRQQMVGPQRLPFYVARTSAFQFLRIAFMGLICHELASAVLKQGIGKRLRPEDTSQQLLSTILITSGRRGDLGDA